jgi:hypothetical protein
MPGGAAGQEEDFTMTEIAHRATKFNENPPIWTGEFSLNLREFIRIELTCIKNIPIFNLRRWFRPDDGPARPTRKGIACAIRHLPNTVTLLNEALRQAQARGLASGEPQR